MANHTLHTLSNTEATQLTPNGIHSGMDITIQNVNDAGHIYVGADSTVSSTSYGYRLLPNHAISFELPGEDALFAIAENNGMALAKITTNLEAQN